MVHCMSNDEGLANPGVGEGSDLRDVTFHPSAAKRTSLCIHLKDDLTRITTPAGLCLDSTDRSIEPTTVGAQSTELYVYHTMRQPVQPLPQTIPSCVINCSSSLYSP
jgi:hypothetical protein